MLTPYPHLQSNISPIILFPETMRENQLNDEDIKVIREILYSKSGVIEKLKRCNFQNAELNKTIQDLNTLIEIFGSLSTQFNIFLPVYE